MAWWQSPIFLAIVVIILVGLLIVYRVLRNRKKPSSSPEKPIQTAQGPVPTRDKSALPRVESNTSDEIMPDAVKIATENHSSEEDLSAKTDRLDQIINPDINLIPDVILNPSEETVLLIMPEHIPTEEVKKFEKFLRKIDALKIVTTGGSSDEGSNIGIRILSPLNLTEVMVNSNMSIVKHLRKKGERIVISLKY